MKFTLKKTLSLLIVLLQALIEFDDEEPHPK